jgi:predicted MFS family arabinose efflux permease
VIRCAWRTLLLILRHLGVHFMAKRRSGLWQRPDFMKLWIGQTISAFGSRISRDAIPLTAFLVLGAPTSDLGLLVAISSLPVLMFGLLVGAWVDRLRRRPLLIAADISRMLLLLSIPFAALTGTLSMPLLFVVAALASTFNLLFDVAYRSVLPSLVSTENVLEGNTKLSTTEALAEIGGPTLAGLLIQLISAPFAVFFDAVSFLFSALSVAMIRAPEPPPAPRDERQSLWCEVQEGLHAVIHHPILRAFAIGMAARSFFGAFYGTLYGFYVIKELGLTPVVLGVLVSAGGIGSLVGALFAGRIPRRFGLGRSLSGALLIGSVIGLLTPFAGGPALLAAGMLMIAQLVGDAAMDLYLINELSLRQVLVPERVLGRVNASMGFLAEGVAPLGALIGGLLGAAIGARATLLIASTGFLVMAIWIAFSPIRRLEAHPVRAG